MSVEQDTSSLGRRVGKTLLFSSYLESDSRSPYVTFSVPPFIAQLLGKGEKNAELGLILPSLEFWIALTMVLLIGCCFNIILSLLSYNCIVLPRRRKQQFAVKDKSNRQQNGDMTPYLTGFGFIMPLCIAFPYYIIPYFGVKNKLLKFFFGVQSLTTFFRCSEAMFGFLPKHVDDSFYNMLVYNLFPVETKFDAKGPLKSTWPQVIYYAKKFGLFLMILGAYCSFLAAYDYEPFAVGEGAALWDVGQLANNALVALLFQLYLTTHGYGIFTITSLCGVQQSPIMLNPIFESSSPSDFWGRRWNLVVHGMLKRGVYKPVRSKYSRLAASLSTFIASGIFHEWLLSIIFLPDNPSLPTRRPTYGQNTAFFIWNAAILALEYGIGSAAIFQILKNNLPSILVSLLVSFTALPMAHWFTFDYVRSDFFFDGQLGFPLVVLRYE